MPLCHITDGRPILDPDSSAVALTKAEQARINGAKSKGPSTAEGKTRSCRNALKHGLTAKNHTVLTIERDFEYQAVLDSALQTFRPDGLFAREMVEEFTHLKWCLTRLRQLETALLDFQIAKASTSNGENETNPLDNSDDPMILLVKAWIASASKDTPPLELLRRYTVSLRSQFNSAYRNYLQLEERNFKRHQRGQDKDAYIAPEFPAAPPEEPAKPVPEVEASEPAPESQALKGSTPMRNEPTEPPHPGNVIAIDSATLDI